MEAQPHSGQMARSMPQTALSSSSMDSPALTLPESLAAAGAEGVMLNHVEKPLTLGVLKKTIERAKEVGLTTIVCADSIVEASMIAKLDPDIIVAEPVS